MYAIQLAVIVFLITATAVYLFRPQLRMLAYKLAHKSRLHSLRHAIAQADANKAENGRKTIVIYNSTAGQYETLEKKKLKQVANLGKNKSTHQTRHRIINHDRVKTIEKKSLYVTK